MKLCKEQVEWARAEKRTFLRQRIEARLATLYLETKDYPVRALTQFRGRVYGGSQIKAPGVLTSLSS